MIKIKQADGFVDKSKEYNLWYGIIIISITEGREGRPFQVL